MQNNQTPDINFQIQMFDTKLKIDLVENCISDIVQKLDADEVFESKSQKLTFETNLTNTYISDITKLIVGEIVERGTENENYSLIIAILDASNLSDFFERIGTIASLAPDITTRVFAKITELYMSQCNKYLVDINEQFLIHSPIFN
jgi:hypothetical protein